LDSSNIGFFNSKPKTLALGALGWGVVILKDIISGPFNYVEKKWLSQNFLLDGFEEMVGVGGGLVVLQ